MGHAVNARRNYDPVVPRSCKKSKITHAVSAVEAADALGEGAGWTDRPLAEECCIPCQSTPSGTQRLIAVRSRESEINMRRPCHVFDGR